MYAWGPGYQPVECDGSSSHGLQGSLGQMQGSTVVGQLLLCICQDV